MYIGNGVFSNKQTGEELYTLGALDLELESQHQAEQLRIDEEKRALQERVQRVATKTKLTSARAAILRYLVKVILAWMERTNLSRADFSEHGATWITWQRKLEIEGLRQNYLSQTLRRMEKDGLLCRLQKKNDTGETIRVALTKLGVEVCMRLGIKNCDMPF